MTTGPTLAAGSADAGRHAFAGARVVVLIYLLALGALLVGYMFLGRGFAHIRIGPVFIGDWVLFLGVAAVAVAFIRARFRPPVTWTTLLLLAFAGLGFLRTAPYISQYGIDALRDGVLWGYAAFALIVYVLVDRRFVLNSFRTYGWIVPVFALWLPICWNLFRIYSREIDPDRTAAVIPLVFFKGGDMAIHAVGAIAFLVLGASSVATFRTFVWRMILFVPLMWTIFVAGTSNRGALITAAVGIVAIVIFAPRSRNWLPFLAAIGLGLTAMVLQGVLVAADGTTPVPSPTPTSSASGSVPTVSTPTASTPTSSASGLGATASPTPRPVDGIAVQNPSFELGIVGDGGIEDWTPFGVGTYNTVEGDAHGGRVFAVVENTGVGYQASLASSIFPFQAGDDIAVSAWVKSITGRPLLEIYVNWYDRAGELLVSQVAGPEAIEATSVWREGVGVQTAPEGTIHAQVLFYESAGAATIGIDDVTVRSEQPPMLPAVDGIAVQNPSFELGVVASGGILDWVAFGVGTYDTVEGDAHGGRDFAVVENTGGGYQASLASSTFPFRAGEDIAVSVWVKSITGRPLLEIYVNWYDGSGELLVSQFAGPEAIEADSTWQEGVGIQTAPEGTTHAQVLFYESAGAATIGLDDVTVKSGQFLPEPPPLAPSAGRPQTLQQMIENLFSVFGESSDPGLEGTKQFRLAWWGEIVDYTVFGEHFWTGKGFGVNLADDDGFQTTADGSLRAPHNSHLTVLARMGVPGFVLWLLLQGAFGIGLLRATLAHRRAGETRLFVIGASILVYWVTMMVDTSFDPYLEGPQGGIWFWSLFGLGLVVMRLGQRGRTP